MAKALWKVPLGMERESSLLHVCADLLKDHAQVVRGKWFLQLPNRDLHYEKSCTLNSVEIDLNYKVS